MKWVILPGRQDSPVPPSHPHQRGAGREEGGCRRLRWRRAGPSQTHRTLWILPAPPARCGKGREERGGVRLRGGAPTASQTPWDAPYAKILFLFLCYNSDPLFSSCPAALFPNRSRKDRVAVPQVLRHKSFQRACRRARRGRQITQLSMFSFLVKQTSIITC